MPKIKIKKEHAQYWESGKIEKRITSGIRDGRGRRIDNPFNLFSRILSLFYIEMTKYLYPTTSFRIGIFCHKKKGGHITSQVCAKMCVSCHVPSACLEHTHNWIF